MDARMEIPRRLDHQARQLVDICPNQHGESTGAQDANPLLLSTPEGLARSLSG